MNIHLVNIKIMPIFPIAFLIKIPEVKTKSIPSLAKLPIKGNEFLTAFFSARIEKLS